MVGHTHFSLWTPLDVLQMDEAIAATDIVNDARGQPPTKRRFSAAYTCAYACRDIFMIIYKELACRPINLLFSFQ